MRLNRRRRRQIRAVGGLVAAALVLGLLASTGGWLDDTLQTSTYDFLMSVTPQRSSGEVTVVGIDDATIAHYGRWPLPRRAYADAVQALRAAGARVIAFDVAFYDESPRPEDDHALAREIRAAGNVILPMQGQGSGVLDADAHVWRYERVVLPIAELRDAAAAMAAVNLTPDTDGRVRRLPLAIAGAGDERYYALPVVATAMKRGSDALGLESQTDQSATLRLGDEPRVIPAALGVDMRVYFISPPSTLVRAEGERPNPCPSRRVPCVVSLVDLVGGRVPREAFEGRIVLVGAHSAAGLPDNYAVPTSAGTKMEGVEIWANAIETIVGARFPLLREESLVTLIWLMLILVAGVALIVRFGLFGLGAAFLLLIAYTLAAITAFSLAGSEPGSIRVPSIAYVLLAVPWWVIVLGYLFIEERLTVQRTQRAFGLAVTPEVARHILELEESGQLGLGGELREATVLFGDIRGFTTISEDMGPRELMATLNRYFTGMVEIVQRYGGTVNKYNGDNVMVIWGAPILAGDHARNAVRCALELQHFIVAEREKGGPDIAFGFGINTGELVAGFLGAQGRFEYTVLGDTVNVASRLTSGDIAKRDSVVVSQRTLTELGDDVVAVDLGSVQVKGRAEPVHSFQIDRLGDLAAPAPRPRARRKIARLAGAG